jgi:ribosomal-protein-alanine N-acetyltransferase
LPALAELEVRHVAQQAIPQEQADHLGRGRSPLAGEPARDCSKELLSSLRTHPMEVRQLTESDAVAIATWRYPGRYATYDVGEIVTPDRGFWAVDHDADLVGYCCFGHEARVPGVVEEGGVLDVGYGMRPDLMGHGLGGAFVRAILDFAVERHDSRRLRLLILDWNDRSRKVAEALGFQSEGVHTSTEGRFVVMTRQARPA